ncbi:MAG TPA: sulfite exporter TauE/SafE family protein [Acidimicrobiia bacterium]|nr:sulfite exporter TauE/SafE family protein [Acidimicrobiia bacterium]
MDRLSGDRGLGRGRARRQSPRRAGAKLLILTAVALVLMTGTAFAHPLGNFTTNVHLGLFFSPGWLELSLVVDMAEIPAFREKRNIDQDSDGIVGARERDKYAAAACTGFRPQIVLRLETAPLVLESRSAILNFPPGQGGLDTLRIECRFAAALSDHRGELQVENQVYADRLGWSEIVASSRGLAIETTLPTASPSEILTIYPAGPARAERAGSILVGAGEGGTLSTPTATTPALVERIGRGVAGGSSALALLAALALGAGHALAPGHGKTLIAAYLVGRRGGPRTAVGLGLSVALSHTLGVGLLGLVTALTTSAFQPESVYPWLSLISALIVTSIGSVMLVRAARRDREHHHPHGHDHPHEHDHDHDHEGDHLAHGSAGWRSLAALGLAGGLVPSASAVVLLLGAVAQGEAWWGLALVAGFGLGMSVSLIGAGLLAVGAQRWGWTRMSSGRWRQTWQLRVPQFGGLAVTLIGVWLVFDAARRFVA